MSGNAIRKVVIIIYKAVYLGDIVEIYKSRGLLQNSYSGIIMTYRKMSNLFIETLKVRHNV